MQTRGFYLELQEKVSVLHSGSTLAWLQHLVPIFPSSFPIQLTMIRGSKIFELPFELLPVLPESSREVPLLVASR